MIEREILKDIKTYDPKFIGPLTLRQFVCGAIGAGITVSMYLFLYYPCNLQSSICIITSGILGVPAFAFGWWKPYGIPLEKFAKKYIELNILSPCNRPYKTDIKNTGIEIQQTEYTKKELKKMKKQRTVDIKELGDDFSPIS